MVAKLILANKGVIKDYLMDNVKKLCVTDTVATFFI